MRIRTLIYVNLEKCNLIQFAYTAEGASQTDLEGEQFYYSRVGALRKEHITRYEINDD